MDWLLGMQDPADGGVWFRVASRNWDTVPPYLITTPHLLAEKNLTQDRPPPPPAR
ncbi:hypothetical protein [uncultured Thiodictyon sp.]|uniref:hypothetical protein n=1 Tax=uncultured Thiodictyon sp. TaxID=1846217 RepID=UPI0025EA1BC6|nr:hypothetical protein [uncultured Thiodictyon sp.]